MNTLAVQEVAVTKSDTVNLPKGVCKAIYCGGDGDITFVDGYGNEVTRVGCLAGSEYNIAAKRIKASTTATNLTAIYTA